MKSESFDLEELISRMCLREPGTSSADSKSWQAYREAERLSGSEIIPSIGCYLEKKRKAPERACAYFILGKVGKNVSNNEAAQHLLTSISSETDKYALATALDMVSELSLNDDEDTSLIIDQLRDKRWLVRRAAIRALKASKSVRAEEALVALLEETDDASDKIYCHSTLGSIGTERSLPAIQASTASRKRDVKASAIYAVKSIRLRLDTR
ncbi:HEAT repeat domain-containing protein [Rhizobium hidalgonense]|uniref:HEAT repeat domain-containing protein n=1 Tax=Rhizobium hidalgonense TaxID=1538159 RepID=UPI0028717895|nr:HEAT repeat domain-containing protein [Rhizobium hidalgonense]MDR9805512.1 HEAT repeat domain-containing protein [Rhizobium hidalgonense]